MEHLTKSQRWDAVLALLARNKRVTVAEIAAQLRISESTVRRDFVEMENAQLARRTHGGLVAIDVAYSLAARAAGAGAGTETSQQREKIAAYVAGLVKPGTIIGFNGGRTTTAVARHVASRDDLISSEGKPGLTVVSGALNIATELVLRPTIRTVVLGGVVEPYSYELTGPLAIEAMNNLWLDHMVIGAIGIDPVAGLTCHNDAEAAVTRTMAAHSRANIGVLTADKIGTRAMASILGLKQLSELVIAGEVPKDFIRHVRNLGIKLTVL